MYEQYLILSLTSITFSSILFCPKQASVKDCVLLYPTQACRFLPDWRTPSWARRGSHWTPGHTPSWTRLADPASQWTTQKTLSKDTHIYKQNSLLNNILIISINIFIPVWYTSAWLEQVNVYGIKDNLQCNRTYVITLSIWMPLHWHTCTLVHLECVTVHNFLF